MRRRVAGVQTLAQRRVTDCSSKSTMLRSVGTPGQVYGFSARTGSWCTDHGAAAITSHRSLQVYRFCGINSVKAAGVGR